MNASSSLSARELSIATDYLQSTRDALLQSLDSLTDSQWRFTPAPGCWSIAETLEHIVLLEDRVPLILSRMPDAPPCEPDRSDWQVEEAILAQVPDRTSKFQAPPHVSPANRWSPDETRTRFLEGRTRTIALLVEAPCLRGHFVPHPILGPWDGYQWILATAAHSARHTKQILELKSHPSFPQSDAV